MNHRAAGAISLASIGSRTAVLGIFLNSFFIYFFWSSQKEKNRDVHVCAQSSCCIYNIYSGPFDAWPLIIDAGPTQNRRR
jgi:hypothetical protein